jgi:aryl-alcohol dehydrogenase-like predicted oxidoreductase
VTIPRQALADNLEVSKAITGLWQIADMERHQQLDLTSLADAMLPYVEAGLTTFDMADHYGSAEDVAGIFRHKHGAAQMLTKWVPEPGAVSKQQVRAAVETSLRRLKVARLELLQFHTWRYADPSWLDALGYLQDLKDEGLIAQLGLTNVDAAHLDMVLCSGIDIVSNQVSCSLIDRRAQGALHEVCMRHSVKLLAYGTVAGGLLSERWLGKPELADNVTWSQSKYGRFIREAGGWQVFQDLLTALNKVAQKKGVSMATVASRYVLEQPAVGAIIIGARLGERSHIPDTLKLFEFSLDKDDLATLKAGMQALKPIPGDCGDEYRKAPFLTASGDLSHHLDNFPTPFETVTRGNKTLALSGTVWEGLAAYCRAVRKGRHIAISGTTATHGKQVIGGQDASAQTHFVIDKLEAALISLGASLEDVTRTRIYVKHIDDWEAVARAHGQRFKEILPANTLVQADLVGEDYLVEIEADAWLE